MRLLNEEDVKKKLLEVGFGCESKIGKWLAEVPDAWIPVTWRPMDEEERSYYEEAVDGIFEDEDAVIFDSPMPEDGQEIWVTTKNGYVFSDVCENDYGIVGLEGNGDWADVIAWQPLYKPAPYKEERYEE